MTPAFDVDAVRADFPILETEVDGHPLVYLDSGATSQKPRAVLDAERDFLERANAAVHRGAHTLAAEATELFEDAPHHGRRLRGRRAGAARLDERRHRRPQPRRGFARIRGRLREGDEIVVTEAEHHANLIPWQELARRTGARLRHIPVLDDGMLDMHAAADLIGERTKVVAFPHVSNVLGIVNPVAKLVTLARAVGALTVLDACQSAPHLALDLPASGVDLAVFSGHKVYGPYGIGALWGRDEVLESLPPFTTGGSMITTVTLDEAEYLPPPQRFEAGTQPVSQAVALAAAVRWLGEHDLAAAHAHEAALEKRMREGLRSIDGIRLLGDTDAAERVALQAFVVEGVHAHDVGQFLDSRGVAVRVGHHCAQPLHRRFGVTASVRASAAIHTTEARDRHVPRRRLGRSRVLRRRHGGSTRMSGLESLYQELILDHAKNRRGFGLAEPGAHSATVHQRNPICGDEITLRVDVEGDRVASVTWEGAGCSISQSSASMLVALLQEDGGDEGMPTADVQALIERFRESLRSRGKIPLDEETFADAAALSGVSKYTARVKCAMLAWVALEEGLRQA